MAALALNISEIPGFTGFSGFNGWIVKILGNFFPRIGSKPETALYSEAESPSRRNETGAADPDLEWVHQFQAGKEMGFNRLVLRHQDSVYNLCFRLLGNSSDAEEAAQEAFVRVYKSLKGFRSESKFSTWLYRIATNASLNIRQSARPREMKGAVEFESIQETLPDPSGGPESDLEQSRLSAEIQAGIKSLPEEFRTALVLRDVEGRDYEEIAAITGANLGTVRSRLHRARDRMRLFLTERGI